MHTGTVACTSVKKRPAAAGNLSASELPTGPLSAVEKPTDLYMSIFFITASKFVINHKKYYLKTRNNPKPIRKDIYKPIGK
jgi:hypothetical protein